MNEPRDELPQPQHTWRRVGGINEICVCMASPHLWMNPEMGCLSHNTPGVGWEESIRSVYVWPPPIYEWTQRWGASATTHLEKGGRNQWYLCMYGFLPFMNEPRDELPQPQHTWSRVGGINEICVCVASSHLWMNPEMRCLSHNTPGVAWEESMISVYVWLPPIHEWTQRWAASATTHLE